MVYRANHLLERGGGYAVGRRDRPMGAPVPEPGPAGPDRRTGASDVVSVGQGAMARGSRDGYDGHMKEIAARDAKNRFGHNRSNQKSLSCHS